MSLVFQIHLGAISLGIWDSRIDICDEPYGIFHPEMDPVRGSNDDIVWRPNNICLRSSDKKEVDEVKTMEKCKKGATAWQLGMLALVLIIIYFLLGEIIHVFGIVIK
jgi:hypothetical protein